MPICLPGNHVWITVSFVFTSYALCDVCGVEAHDEERFAQLNGVRA